MPSNIPMGDLRREYARLHSKIDQAVERVLQRGWFILGEEGEAFEAAWAEYCGVAHAVGVGNGTDALQLALRAAGIGAGDEVVVPALTAAFTALAVSMAGATPVFADVDPERYTLDPAAFEAAITPRTAAVVPVHLYGCPADMEAIVAIARRHNLLVLEDAAQAHGARIQGRRVGGLGDVAAFSFYPSKNLGAYGDAGALVTNDAALAEKVRMMRHGGQRGTYEHELLGTNSRLDEIQAAILRAKLPYLDRWNDRRRVLAARYESGLRACDALRLPVTPHDVEHVFHLYVVRTPVRDALRGYLAGTEIQTSIHYPKGVHLQGAYASLGYKVGSCPHAEAATGEILSLPIFPQLTVTEVDQVARMIRFFFAMR
jgi:dTDP-3-amino-3,4,6-trideoxy-alpha-D-glucose transaminase